MTQPNASPNEPQRGLTGRQTYNVVSDTAIGLNFRARDNLWQGVFILAWVVVGLGAGWLASDVQPLGILIGATAGLIVGFLVSGVFLMIYRLGRHLQGKHD
ncbi:MAG: hypothetical protein HY719_08150 [Planctomycetes bacterium]|nr:hypothetical protein [Planctomycetota bacterium]